MNTSSTEFIAVLDTIKAELRNEYRVKLNTDYAVIAKGGAVRVLCASCYADLIQEVFARHGLMLSSVHTY